MLGLVLLAAFVKEPLYTKTWFLFSFLWGVVGFAPFAGFLGGWQGQNAEMAVLRPPEPWLLVLCNTCLALWKMIRIAW